MKQIKLLMLTLCLSFFGAVNAQVETVIQYVATYTWTGATNTQWSNGGNWTVTHNAPVGTVVPVFPNVTVGALSQIHNVVIPAGLTNYPSMAAGALTITVSNLDIAAGASVTLGGRTLVINGFISGTGELVGGQVGANIPNVTFNAHDNLGVYTDMTAHNATFNGLFYSENFNLYNGDLNAGNNGPSPLVPLDFPDQNLYSFAALANPGGLFVFNRTDLGIVGDQHTIQLSTKVELDDLEISFNGAPVYTFSGYFSITDFDYSPMTLGKIVEFNAGQLTPTTTNEVAIVVTLTNGAIFDYEANATGEYVGFTSSVPIASITVGSAVFISNIQNVGFATVDDLKFGTRVPTGTAFFRQATATSKQIGNLTINDADAASLLGGVTLGSPLEVTNTVYPVSGVLNSTVAGNLVLASNATATATVASHTAAATIDGNVTVQRHFASVDPFDASARNKQWRFIGFPYSTPTLISGITGINYSVVTPTMMRWRDVFANGSLGTGGARNAGYANYTGTGQAITSGDGLVAWIYDNAGVSPTSGTLGGAQTMVTSGLLNESGAAVTKALGYDDLAPVIADAGWNLISNPFAATIDWNNAAIVKTGLTGTIYRWDPQAANWTTFNGTVGTGLGDQYIESGSSFFVKANAVGANVSFGQDAKVLATTSGLYQFGKNGSKLELAQQKVGATQKPAVTGLRFKASGPGNPIPAEAFLGLSVNDATAAFDDKYDAFNKGRASGANVAIQGQDKNNFAMQFDKPIVENGKEKRYYPLTVTVPEAGKTKLEMNVEGTWNSLNKVYLIDNKEGKTIPLSGNKLSYEFTMAATEESDRFVLAINHVNVAEKSGITATDVRVMNNPVRADVIDAIIAHPSAKAKSYSVVNASGATVNKGSIEDNNSVQHRLGFGKSNANGVMYLRVDFENGDSKTVKFIKL
ncbi:MAG: hypothetical protein RLZZ204_580 [Bacteroidota bacterium]|jgi:hypothetical protein